MNDEIISAGSMMQQFFNVNLNKNAMELPNAWRKVLSRVRENDQNVDEISFGEKLANNSHVVDLKNGVLLVEANHPGWVQYLKMYQKFIMTGLNRELPELKIKNLAFRVAGTEVSLSESYEASLKKDQEKMARKIEADEKTLNKVLKQPESAPKGQLPQELLDKFESMKESMLTNSRK